MKFDNYYVILKNEKYSFDNSKILIERGNKQFVIQDHLIRLGREIPNKFKTTAYSKYFGEAIYDKNSNEVKNNCSIYDDSYLEFNGTIEEYCKLIVKADLEFRYEEVIANPIMRIYRNGLPINHKLSSCIDEYDLTIADYLNFKQTNTEIPYECYKLAVDRKMCDYIIDKSNIDFSNIKCIVNEDNTENHSISVGEYSMSFLLNSHKWNNTESAYFSMLLNILFNGSVIQYNNINKGIENLIMQKYIDTLINDNKLNRNDVSNYDYKFLENEKLKLKYHESRI